MRALIVLLTALAAFPAAADPKLAEKKNCLACHGIKDKMVGPALREIAAKYGGQTDAPSMLAEKIQKGGVGAWGQIPMPPNDVTSDEAKTLASWVMTLK